MATVVLTSDFLTSYGRFESKIKKAVDQLMDKIRHMTFTELNASKGTHLESYKGSRDPKSRTLRVDDNHRLIAMDLGDNDRLLFVRVSTHDDADKWMKRNEFRVNEAVGAIEVFDISVLDRATETANGSVEDLEVGLYRHRKDKEFTQLGVDADLVPMLRAFTEEEQLEPLIGMLPPNQAEAVIELLGDESADVLYGRIAGDVDSESIDPTDFVTALDAPASQAGFKVVSSDDELASMLARPLEQWRIYLHHSQRAAAYRPVYSGPARVTGGAGTGKTVVAMHRAYALAQPYLAGTLSYRGRPILFTTFTRNLAQSIERDLRSLGGSEILDVVEVMNVDRLSHRVVQDADPNPPHPSYGDFIQRAWTDVVDERDLDLAPEFLQAEWEHVILAQRIASRSDYFQASRAGRGIRLDRRSRATVWAAVETFTQKLVSTNTKTYLQMADAAAGYLDQRDQKPYNHVIVDEAQDIHETQWRLLRAAVAEGENDMFIVGDSHQRIYDRRSSLSKVGINIVGRSRKLHINYRTTAQILRWAMALLGEERYDDLDDGVDDQTFAGYFSFLTGERPTLCDADSRKAQMDSLVEQVLAWLESGAGIEVEDIGIAARARASLDGAKAALLDAGIQTHLLEGDLKAGDGVRLGTMHRMKGLEFRCVAAVDVDDSRIPSPRALTDKASDEVQHRLDLQRERCLLYVACTRARDHLWVGWSGNPSRFLGPMIGS